MGMRVLQFLVGPLHPQNLPTIHQSLLAENSNGVQQASKFIDFFLKLLSHLKTLFKICTTCLKFTSKSFDTALELGLMFKGLFPLVL